MTRPSWLSWILAEPRVTDVPPRRWWDYALVAALVATITIEAIARDDLVFPWFSVPIVMVLATLLLWRRTHSLPVFLVTVGAFILMDVAATLRDEPPVEIYSMALILALMYAVARWASGPEVFIGVGAALTLWVAVGVLDYSGVGDLIGSLIVMLLPFEAGGLVRYQKSARLQAVERAKVEERAELARELHDTVAHRVSAIAIQAQVGRMLAENSATGGDNDKLNDALVTIEEEASRTLAEMRHMVGSLREPSPGVQMSPQQGLDDIPTLATAGTWPGIEVRVDLEPGLDVDAITGASLYRIAQESVTNAARHARAATRVDVTVSRIEHHIELVVTDDGTPGATREGNGFGLLGLEERAERLGGTFRAGSTASGWQVVATLPDTHTSEGSPLTPAASP